MGQTKNHLIESGYYEQYELNTKPLSCKLRSKLCESYGCPCDVCTTYEPIRRRRDS